MKQIKTKDPHNTYVSNYRLSYKIKQVLRYGLGFPVYGLQAFTNWLGLSAIGDKVLPGQTLESKQEFLDQTDTLNVFCNKILQGAQRSYKDQKIPDQAYQEAEDLYHQKDYEGLYEWFQSYSNKLPPKTVKGAKNLYQAINAQHAFRTQILQHAMNLYNNPMKEHFQDQAYQEVEALYQQKDYEGLYEWLQQYRNNLQPWAIKNAENLYQAINNSHSNDNTRNLDRDPVSAFVRKVYSLAKDLLDNNQINDGQYKWFKKQIAKENYNRLVNWFLDPTQVSLHPRTKTEMIMAYQNIHPINQRNAYEQAYIDEKQQRTIQELNASKSVQSATQPTVITEDGLSLDTVEVVPSTDNQNESDNQYIIKFLGNEERWPEKKDEIQQDVEQGYRVIAFNPRGVGASDGRAFSKDDLVKDGIAQVEQVLQKEGVSAENVMIDGHSLGAGYGTLVADYCHNQRKNPKKVKLKNGRSFSSVTNIIIGQFLANIAERPGHALRRGCLHVAQYFNKQYKNSENQAWSRYFHPLRIMCKALQQTFKILGFALHYSWQLPLKALIKSFKPLAKGVLLLANWEINAGDAFKRIPNQYKACYRVATPESYKPAYHKKYKNNNQDFDIIPHHHDKQDGIIADYASICHSKTWGESLQSLIHNNLPSSIAKHFKLPHINADMSKACNRKGERADPNNANEYHTHQLFDTAGHMLSQTQLVTRHSPLISKQLPNAQVTNAKELSHQFFDTDPNFYHKKSTV